eukprot:NODE_501_length_7561_cov_0.489547.p2 type:complete len:331 gc:universal NODE_501_length_7561_cov_0.489547:672-1664(+)
MANSDLTATLISVLFIYRLDKLFDFSYFFLSSLVMYLPYTVEEYIEKIKIKLPKNKTLEYDVEASYKDLSNVGLRAMQILPRSYLRKHGTLDKYFFFEQYQQLTLFSIMSMFIIMIMSTIEYFIPSNPDYTNISLGLTWSVFAIFTQLMFLGLAIESKSQLLLIGLAATQGFFAASLFTIHSNFSQPLMQVYFDVSSYFKSTKWLSQVLLDEKVFMLGLTLIFSIVTALLTVPFVRKYKCYSIANKSEPWTGGLLYLEVISPLVAVVCLLSFDSTFIHFPVVLIDILLNVYLFKIHCQSFLNIAKIKSAAIFAISGRTKIQIFRNTVLLC